MNRRRPHSVGFALGTLIGLWHALWAVIDFIFRLHMIAPPYKIAAFDPGLALALVLVTAIIGYLFGWIGAVIWNRYGIGVAPRIDSSSN